MIVYTILIDFKEFRTDPSIVAVVSRGKEGVV